MCAQKSEITDFLLHCIWFCSIEYRIEVYFENEIIACQGHCRRFFGNHSDGGTFVDAADLFGGEGEHELFECAVHFNLCGLCDGTDCCGYGYLLVGLR